MDIFTFPPSQDRAPIAAVRAGARGAKAETDQTPAEAAARAGRGLQETTGR